MIRPDYTVIAGPNGSGKTSVLRLLDEIGVSLDNYYNADDLTRAGASNADAQLAVRGARDSAISARQSFTYETVMSHASHLTAMQAARDAGFFVRLIFVTTDDPEINVARVANRVRLGGHDVPQRRIRSRYARVMQDMLVPAIAIADEALVFDNSHDGSGNASPVAHVIGLYIRRYATPHLLWPDRWLWPTLVTKRNYFIDVVTA